MGDSKAKATSWINPNRELLEEATKLELQRSSGSSDFAIKLEVVTVGEYPDGTKWERKEPTEETAEAEEESGEP